MLRRKDFVIPAIYHKTNPLSHASLSPAGLHMLLTRNQQPQRSMKVISKLNHKLERHQYYYYGNYKLAVPTQIYSCTYYQTDLAAA